MVVNTLSYKSEIEISTFYSILFFALKTLYTYLRIPVLSTQKCVSMSSGAAFIRISPSTGIGIGKRLCLVSHFRASIRHLITIKTWMNKQRRLGNKSCFLELQINKRCQSMHEVKMRDGKREYLGPGFYPLR